MNMGHLLVFLGLIAMVLIMSRRFKKATNRIQACLDNGSLEGDCLDNIVVSSSLSQTQRNKVHCELRLYIEFNKLFEPIDKGLVFPSSDSCDTDPTKGKK